MEFNELIFLLLFQGEGIEDLLKLDRYILRNNGVYKKKKKVSKMFGRPQMKGVVLRVSRFAFLCVSN